MRAKNLYCFRHGQTDWNKEKRYQGWTDIPLNETGRSQAKQLTPLVKQFSLESLYASPLKRAWETAQIIAAPIQLNVIPHHGLIEIDVGTAAGLTETEIMQQFGPDAVVKWKSDDADHESFCFPGSEKKANFRKRALQALLTIAETAKESNIGIVTHGHFLKQLIIATGCTDHFHLKNTEVVHFTYDPSRQQLMFVRRIGINEV